MTQQYTSIPALTVYVYGAMEPAVADRAHGYLLQVKNFDNSLMWTRSSIILLVQGGILAILSSQFGNLADKYPTLFYFFYHYSA
jgi:hypothetical protein